MDGRTDGQFIPWRILSKVQYCASLQVRSVVAAWRGDVHAQRAWWRACATAHWCVVHMLMTCVVANYEVCMGGGGEGLVIQNVFANLQIPTADFARSMCMHTCACIQRFCPQHVHAYKDCTILVRGTIKRGRSCESKCTRLLYFPI